MSESDDLAVLRSTGLRKAIDNLDDLLGQGERAFLIGAGCSKCAGLPLTSELTAQVLASNELTDTSKSLLAGIKSSFNGADAANIEDYLSELVDLLAIADRRFIRNATNCKVTVAENQYEPELIRRASEEIKVAISKAIGITVDPCFHRRLAKVLHRPLRPGMLGRDRGVDYIILNYDTLFEDALALERVKYSDGMNGGATGWWDPSLLLQPDLSARVFKLHGSIDWREVSGDPFPRRFNPKLTVDDGSARQIVIWPAATKYRETQLNPYAQLLEHARSCLTPTEHSQRVLVACGYRETLIYSPPGVPPAG